MSKMVLPLSKQDLLRIFLGQSEPFSKRFRNFRPVINFLLIIAPDYKTICHIYYKPDVLNLFHTGPHYDYYKARWANNVTGGLMGYGIFEKLDP